MHFLFLRRVLRLSKWKKTDLNIVLSSDEPFYLGAGQDGDRKANSNPAQYYKKWNFTMPVMRTSKKNASTAGKIIKRVMVSNGLRVSTVVEMQEQLRIRQL